MACNKRQKVVQLNTVQQLQLAKMYMYNAMHSYYSSVDHESHSNANSLSWNKIDKKGTHTNWAKYFIKIFIKKVYYEKAEMERDRGQEVT